MFERLFWKRVAPKEETHLTHRLSTWGSALPSFTCFRALDASAEAGPGLLALLCNAKDITGKPKRVAQPLVKGWQDTAEGTCLLCSALVPSGMVGEPRASPAPQSNSEYYKMWAGEPLAQNRRETILVHGKGEHFSWSIPLVSRVRTAHTGSLLPKILSRRARSTLSSLTHKLRAMLSLMSNRVTS